MFRNLRIFRIAGIDVFLHPSWFLVALYEIQSRGRNYTSPAWNAAEYLSLFLMVLLHEFGHASACRQVGGVANRIVLWPLGGVAYVTPPPWPGALLWTIAAGPLVNVALVPVLWLLGHATAGAAYDVHHLFRMLWRINLGLLIFNLLPIYPLDGGQILRALLWFWIGMRRSLLVASLLGILGAGLIVALAVWLQSVWLGVIALYMAGRCWNAFKRARTLVTS